MNSINSHINNLPEELLLKCFSYLSGKELQQVEPVCRLWQALYKDEFLWKDLCTDKGLLLKRDDVTWLSTFQSHQEWENAFEEGNVVHRKPKIHRDFLTKFIDLTAVKGKYMAAVDALPTKLEAQNLPIKIWDLETNTLVATLKIPEGNLTNAWIDIDFPYVTLFFDGFFFTYNIEKGSREKILVNFSTSYLIQHGSFIACFDSRTGRIKLLDTEQNVLVHEFTVIPSNKNTYPMALCGDFLAYTDAVASKITVYDLKNTTVPLCTFPSYDLESNLIFDGNTLITKHKNIFTIRNIHNNEVYQKKMGGAITSLARQKNILAIRIDSKTNAVYLFNIQTKELYCSEDAQWGFYRQPTCQHHGVLPERMYWVGCVLHILDPRGCHEKRDFSKKNSTILRTQPVTESPSVNNSMRKRINRYAKCLLWKN